jgi:hypothetical protein
MKIVTLLALPLVLGLTAGAMLAAPGPQPGCECLACACPDCPCFAGEVPCQVIDHLPRGADPAIWHPDILSTAKGLDVAAQKFGRTCDKVSALADGALGHAYSAGAWSVGPIALILGVVFGMLATGLARVRPVKP